MRDFSIKMGYLYAAKLSDCTGVILSNESLPYQQGKSGCKEPAFKDGCETCNGRKGSKRTVISNDFIIIHQLL